MRTRALLTLLLVGALGGCAAMSGANLGVTPGGSQDIGLARTIIGDGGIPDQSQFRVEGLFSEHDLPLPDEACADLLCPRAAATPVEPVDDAGPRMLVQLGFATSVTSETFQRQPQNMALVVDISGSMEGGKMDSVQEALHTLAGQLDEGDHVALVAFDSRVEIRLSRRSMDAAGREALGRAIDGLDPRGSTDIEAGLHQGYSLVAPHAGADGVGDRVMLFTDARPNTGATDLGSFLGMARYYGASGIGISVFGVGLDLGAELATEVSEVRGGNSFYLADDEAIARVFDEEFDYIVTPLAYDLEVTVDAAEGLRFDEAFGAPLDQPGPKVEFGASTLFLSARDGGMGVTIEATTGELPTEGPAQLATFQLSYLERDAASPTTATVSVPWQGGVEIAGQQTSADALGVYKMSVLLDEYLALTAAAEYCDQLLTREEALARIGEAEVRLQEVATHLGDEPLEAEVALMSQLANNVTLEGTCWTEEFWW